MPRCSHRRQTLRKQCLASIGWPSRSVHRRTLKGGIHLLRSQAPLRAVSWNWAVECGSGSRERERAARRSSNTKTGHRTPAGLGRPSPEGVVVGEGMMGIGRSGSASRMVGVGLETKKGDCGAPDGDGLQCREGLMPGDGDVLGGATDGEVTVQGAEPSLVPPRPKAGRG